MLAMDAVKRVMELRGLRIVDLAGKLNINKNVLIKRCTQQNVSIGKLNEMLRPMNYKVVIMPETSETPDDAFTIE